jgi:hypothetical protein
MAKERINKLKNISIETSQTKIQRRISKSTAENLSIMEEKSQKV